MPKRILFLAAHPDDIETVMGGAAVAHSAAGDLCYEAIMTRGEKGALRKSRRGPSLAAIREREGRGGGAVMGMKEVLFFDFQDAALKNTERLRGVISDLIRRFEPEIIYAPEFHRSPYPHPDHLNLGRAVWEIWNGLPQKPVLRFFHPLDPTHIYSVEQYQERKSTSLAMHHSQRWLNRILLSMIPLALPHKYFKFRRVAGSKHFEFYREVKAS